MNPLINDYAMEKQVKLSIAEIKVLDEYFRMMYTQAGASKNWSVLVLDNLNMLEMIDQVIETKLKTAGMMPPDRTEEYAAKKNELAAKFIDRDEQGEGKFSNTGEPIITDMIVEYNEAVAQLDKQYPEVVAYQPKDETLILEEEIEFMLVIPKEYRLLPEQLPPILLAIFNKFYS